MLFVVDIVCMMMQTLLGGEVGMVGIDTGFKREEQGVWFVLRGSLEQSHPEVYE